MTEHLRSAVVPIYVLLCLALGGSAQGIWSNAGLQLLAIAIIAWSVLLRSRRVLAGPTKSLFALLALAISLILVQLIPLPAAMWTALPGRDFVVEGFHLIGEPIPWLSLSLTSYATSTTALTLLPPMAVLSGMVLAGAYRSTWLAVSILLGTFAGVLVGALQVGSADPYTSPWYFYKTANFGSATGFFANSNHFGALLVVCIPILCALVRDLRDQANNSNGRLAVLLLGVAGGLVLSVGIMLNGSLAIVLLGPPIIAVSSLMLLGKGMRLGVSLTVLGLLSVLAIFAVQATSLHDRLRNASSLEERQRIWSNTIPAITDHLPLGSGLSSFPELYPRYENPQAVTRTFANHAHNDYLELALETGVPGILLIIAFLGWWWAQTRPIWRSQRTSPYLQAATIVTAALLLHSVVDYPLRTAALSAIMAACLAIMAQPWTQNRASVKDLWQTRHVMAST